MAYVMGIRKIEQRPRLSDLLSYPMQCLLLGRNDGRVSRVVAAASMTSTAGNNSVKRSHTMQPPQNLWTDGGNCI